MENGEQAGAGEESSALPEASSDGGESGGRGAVPPELLVAMKTVAAAIATGVLWYVVCLVLDNGPQGPSPTWHQCLATLTVVVALLLVWRENHMWRHPSRRVVKIVEGCRAGEVPIGELQHIGGGLGDVAEAVQTLLHDLRHQRKLTSDLEFELSQRVASRTVALERQMSSLRVQATRDPLTGLHNRRMLEECLPKMVQKCREKGSDLSILAIDVDNFKPLNDSLGHAMGDDFLRSIAQILRSGVRECDTAIRCGGDEFIILLPGCPLEAARSLGDRLAAVVHSLAKTIKSPVPPGLSVGAASIKWIPSAASAEQEMSALLEAADKQLYLKKATRKRRVA